MGSYEGELRELCLRLKHERNAWLAPCLSELLVEARRDAFSALSLVIKPWSFRFRFTGGATGGAGTTRPRRWPKV